MFEALPFNTTTSPTSNPSISSLNVIVISNGELKTGLGSVQEISTVGWLLSYTISNKFDIEFSLPA